MAEIDLARLQAPHYDPDAVLAVLGRRGHIAFEVHDNDPMARAGPLGAHRPVPVAQYPYCRTLKAGRPTRGPRPSPDCRDRHSGWRHIAESGASGCPEDQTRAEGVRESTGTRNARSNQTRDARSGLLLPPQRLGQLAD